MAYRNVEFETTVIRRIKTLNTYSYNWMFSTDGFLTKRIVNRKCQLYSFRKTYLTEKKHRIHVWYSGLKHMPGAFVSSSTGQITRFANNRCGRTCALRPRPSTTTTRYTTVHTHVLKTSNSIFPNTEEPSPATSADGDDASSSTRRERRQPNTRVALIAGDKSRRRQQQLFVEPRRGAA